MIKEIKYYGNQIESSKNDDSPENISEDATADAATCSSSDTCTTNNTSPTLSSLQPLLEKGMVPISSNYKQCVFFVLNFVSTRVQTEIKIYQLFMIEISL